MLRALIVDDEAPARSELRAQLAQFPVEVVGEATGAQEAAQLIAAIEYDLVFLDIHMPGISGLDLVKELMARSRCPLVVFTTAYPQYAVEAFGVGAVDYLVKPFGEERLARTLERVHARLSATQAQPPAQSQSSAQPAAAPVERMPVKLSPLKSETVSRLPVDVGGKALLLDPTDIVFAYAIDELVYVKLAHAKYRVSYTMRELEERLGPAGFVRTHRRYLVNIAKVREVNRYFKGALGLIVEDNERSEVPVSRALAPVIRPRLGF